MEKSERLLLVDGNSIVNRAYYAFAGQGRLVTKDGFATNAVYGFLNIYYKYVDEVKPTHVLVAFDMRAPTFRHREFDGYKAGRKGMPDDLAAQLPVLKDIIDALGVRRAECEGYEADDILGTLSNLAEAAGAECVILTGDRDSLQLVSQTTRVLLPVTRAGQTRTEEYDVAAMRAKYGVTPERFIDVKALMGDSSDNIPGVRGIGEKTALELVGAYGGLDDIYADIDRIEKNAVREKLLAGRDMAYMSRRLATIVRNAPCGVAYEDTALAAPDRGRLYALFSELQFQSYILKMGLTETDVTPLPAVVADGPLARDAAGGAVTRNMEGAAAPADNGEPILVCTAAELEAMIATLRAAGEFVFYPLFEKTGRFSQPLFAALCRCRGASFYFETADAAEQRVFAAAATAETQEPAASKTPGLSAYSGSQIIEAFRPLFSDPGIKITGHDVKRICRWLLKNGAACPAFAFDTMLGGYVADAASGDYDLPGLCLTYTGRSVSTVDGVRGRGKARLALTDIGATELADIMDACAAAIGELAPALRKLISDNGQDDLYYNIELPLAEVLASMEVKGFRVDTRGLIRFSDELDAVIEGLTAAIYELAGETFNINSTRQLGVILYEKLALKPVKKTKTGYSTDIDALDALAGKHAIIDKIIEYRQHMKLKSTYTAGLAELVDPADGRIHTTMNQAVTATGRISSTEPNLQNIPVRLALGREVRRLFVPEAGWSLLGADYSQIELRVLAHISEDEGLAEAFREGLDIHRSTASKVFGVPEAEVTSEMRTRAKAVNFGIVYGIGDFSLARDIGVTRKEAREYIDSYLDRYQGVRSYMTDSVEEGKRLGYARTVLGRRRSLPELRSSSYNTRSFGERVAMNTPVQGSAADIIKIAMVRVYRKLKAEGLASALILQVHDELIIEARADELASAAGILRDAMENAVGLSVPLIADVYCGENWRDIKNPIQALDVPTDGSTP